jgi:hypothetical protein
MGMPITEKSLIVISLFVIPWRFRLCSDKICKTCK